MRITLDGRELPMFKKMTVKDAAALSSARAIGGQLNVDRSYQRSAWAFDYDFFDITDYQYIKSLYERHFTDGVFFQLQVTGTDYPVNAFVFISPQSIVPKWGGITVADFTLELIEK